MLNLIILLLLAGLAFFAWRTWRMNQSTDSQAAPTPGSARLDQVYPGGMIQLPPHGDDLDALDMQITARHCYEQDGYQWLELEGDSQKGTTWLDVEEDDELETSVTLQRLRLDDIGLSADQLPTLEPGKAPPVEWQGKRFHLEEKGQARFLPNGDRDRAQALEFWDFAGDDDSHDLTVERWGEDYRVYLSQRLTPSRITIYSLGESA